MDDGWIPAEKTQHREEHQECDKHDGAKKKPLACRDRLHISSPAPWSVSIPACRS